MQSTTHLFFMAKSALITNISKSTQWMSSNFLTKILRLHRCLSIIRLKLGQNKNLFFPKWTGISFSQLIWSAVFFEVDKDLFKDAGSPVIMFSYLTLKLTLVFLLLFKNMTNGNMIEIKTVIRKCNSLSGLEGILCCKKGILLSEPV